MLAPALVTKLLQSLFWLAMLLLVRYLLARLVRSRTEDVSLRYQWRRGTNYALMVIGLFVFARIWVSQVGSVATYLGLVTAGVAIALQEPISNLAGFAFILWRRPLELGDRIEVNDTKGDVVDINFFNFTLLEIGNWVDADQNTGRFVHVPNRVVFGRNIANYTADFPFVWHEMEVVVTYESAWEEAKTHLYQIMRKHVHQYTVEAQKHVSQNSGRLLVRYGKLTPIIYISGVDHGIELAMRMLVPVRRRRGVSTAIWEDILQEFNQATNIELAYPTQRFIGTMPFSANGVATGASERTYDRPQSE